METNTVLLSVEQYNELRDLQKEVKNGKVFSFSRSWGHGRETNYFFTEDEVVEKFETKIKELEAKNNKLEVKINDLKKMSYWDFRKWRES